MSNIAADAPTAWLKLRLLVENIDNFYLSPTEIGFINTACGSVLEAVAIITAGPAPIVEFEVAGPYRWSAGNLAISLAIPEATGTVNWTPVTDDNSVDSVVITYGSVYSVAPVVTFSAATTTTATGIAVLNAKGQVVSVTITEPGSYLDTDLPITVSFAAAPTLAVDVDITTEDSTADVVLHLQQAIEADTKIVYCTGVPADGIESTGSIIQLSNGADLEITSLLLT